VQIQTYKVTQGHVLVFVSLHSNKDTSHYVTISVQTAPKVSLLVTAFLTLFPKCLIYKGKTLVCLQINCSYPWRKQSSGMWHRVEVVLTDVSEERITSIFRVEGKIRKSAREASVRGVKSRLFLSFMVLFTKEYLPTSVLCFLLLTFQLWSSLLR
jgi:hypothetical protein